MGGAAGTVNTSASGATAGSEFQSGNINPTSSFSVNYGGGGSSYANPNIVSNIAYLNGVSTTHQGHGKVVIR